MTIEERYVGQVFILDLNGALRQRDGKDILTEKIDLSLRQDKKQILLNLKECRHLDSAGIGTLVHLHTTADRQGAAIKICGLNQHVTDQLSIRKLMPVLDIYEDEAAALASFNS